MSQKSVLDFFTKKAAKKLRLESPPSEVCHDGTKERGIFLNPLLTLV